MKEIWTRTYLVLNLIHVLVLWFELITFVLIAMEFKCILQNNFAQMAGRRNDEKSEPPMAY
jgi:hypothetical protein